MKVVYTRVTAVIKGNPHVFVRKSSTHASAIDREKSEKIV